MRIQHVLAVNIDLQEPFSSGKPPEPCNRRDTVPKGGMKLPDSLHKDIMDDIIRRGAIDFIEND